jgi:rhamnulokinase
MSSSVAAVDLGAATGRVFVGRLEGDRLSVERVARFRNAPLRMRDGLHWNVTGLWADIVAGLRLAAEGHDDLESVGIDSWGADYALLRGGRLLGIPYHYQDERGAVGAEATHALVPQEELYRRTGLEPLPFNTLYQLAADHREGALAAADALLFTPDLLGFWLTGRAATEPTIASTSGLLDARTRTWDRELVQRLGLPDGLLPVQADPGSELGPVTEPIAGLIGPTRRLTVRKVASHDTASAVVGTPLERPGSAYLSCGTWALLGVEVPEAVLTERARTERFTNEAGLDGRVLLQRNLMGLGLVNDLLQETPDAGLERILAAAAGVRLDPAQLIDPADPVFLRHGRTSTSIREWLAARGVPAPEGVPALVRCVLESLAQAFAGSIGTLEELTGRRIPAVHIVGGGSQNALLCQATADRSGRPVIAGPVEASVLGNVLVQARALGLLEGTVDDLRAAARASLSLLRYEPR